MENKVRYPLEVNNIVRKKTFYVNSHLSPANPEEGEPPLKIFGHWSRYEFCVINDQKKAATANVDLASMRKILRESNIYFQRHMNLLSRNKSGKATTSIAYTTKLTGKYNGQTPADILLSKGEQGKTELENQKQWLVNNLARYPKNQGQIDAINDAINLYANGQLDKSKASNTRQTVYCVTTRPLIRKKAPQQIINKYPQNLQAVIHPCYEIKIDWDLGAEGYPVRVSIFNYYCPVTQDPKTKMVNVLRSQMCKDDGTHTLNSMDLTVDEWMETLENIKADIDMFRMLYAKKMYSTAMSIDKSIRSQWSNPNNNASSPKSEPVPATNNVNSANIAANAPQKSPSANTHQSKAYGNGGYTGYGSGFNDYVTEPAKPTQNKTDTSDSNYVGNTPLEQAVKNGDYDIARDDLPF